MSGYFGDEITISDYCLATVRKKESPTNLSFTQRLILNITCWETWLNNMTLLYKNEYWSIAFFQCSNTSITFPCCITVCFKSVCTNSKSLLHKWKLFDAGNHLGLKASKFPRLKLSPGSDRIKERCYYKRLCGTQVSQLVSKLKLVLYLYL